jgi:NRPS condensation-like uncharacterized protein
MVATIPFTPVDEAIAHLEDAGDPWNIQFEVAIAGHVDLERLRDAVRTACLRHPLSRARRAAEEGTWEIPPDVDLDAVSLEPVADMADLTRLRTEVYSDPIALTLAPPLRVIVARFPDHDVVMFDVNHVPLDGMATVRFANSVAAAYRGVPDPDDPLPLDRARDLDGFLRIEDARQRFERFIDNVARLRDPLPDPTRIAPDGGTDGARGHGFVTAALSSSATRDLVTSRPRNVSVNDVLLACLHLAIDRWNADHGQDTDRIGLMMPVNVRPAEWSRDVVGNYALFVSLSTTPVERTSLHRAIGCIADQTGVFKERYRLAALYDLLDPLRPLPGVLRRVLPHLLPVTRERFGDTALASNLGVLPVTPTFEDGPPADVWFSPPAPHPVSAGIGAVTVNGALHLVLRYGREQFGPDAAQAFLDQFLAVASEL